MSRTKRILHLGLGAFARAHLAWYTKHAGDDTLIVPLESRVTRALQEQGGRYGLITRGPEADVAEEIDNVEGCVSDLSLLGTSSRLSIVTLTVTEAGYLPGARPPALIVDGLRARRDAGRGALALVPLDNVPSNGRVLREAVLSLAQPKLASWIDDNVSFVTTMVDRITPATTPSDVVVAKRLLGWADAIPVVTEPFSEWVLQGEFPAGRPAWETAGAQFVDDVEPYEQRKLWMLNGAHSLLAYRGLELGHSTVFAAWGDPVLAAEVEQLWSEAREVLTLPAAEVDGWLAALRIRFENPRIEHRLAQIALGGEQKIPARIGGVIRAREAAGLLAGTAELETIAAWDRSRNSTT